jgi:acyl-CoA synthetase (AMP-forming)/AMP-acid ligase II
MEVPLLLEMAAGSEPDRVAIASPDGAVSYHEALARARAVAAWLRGQPAERLVYVGLNGADFPVALFAAGVAGVAFVPLNYRLSDIDLRRLLARSAPAVAIIDEDMVSRIGEVDGIVLLPRDMLATIAIDPAWREIELAPAETEIAVLLFTSGTTGDPKAAVLRHSNLTSYVISTVEFMGADDGEAALISVPPYHIAGISAVLTGIYNGRKLVYLPAFTAESWVETVARERVTHAMVVPTMLGRILDVIETGGMVLPALRALSYGGGRMPLPVIERAMALLPDVDFVNAYGLTETSSTIAILGPEDHRSAIASDNPAVRRRLGSVGRPLPTLELEIRDGAGAVCPPGSVGEVHVRGEQVSGEYLGKSMLTADGWFPTNDSGFLDEEGYLFVEGRLDDVIVRGGENISPGEVEDVLRLHPDIRDVAVFGVPDDQWGERVAAVVVPSDNPPTSAALAEWVRARLRSTKTPESWAYRDALPYNDAGKLLRRVLKAEFSPSLTA